MDTFMCYLLGITLIVPIFLFLKDLFKTKTKTVDLNGKHVMITGGSSGIGKSVAFECVKKGAKVSLLARNKERLTDTKQELDSLLPKNCEERVSVFSVDISEYKEVVNVVENAEVHLGPIDMLINCAGTSISGRFEEVEVSEFKRMMDVNYFGSVHVTRAVVPSMKKRNSGKIVFTSSLAGFFGLYGYTCYSPSKFALRGLAESLQMEVKPYGISVTLCFPPDTDTPGFSEEQKSKPEETKLISENGGLVSPDYVAKKLLEDTINERFFSTVNTDGQVLGIVCAGMSPISSFSSLIAEVFFMGISRLVSVMYLSSFNTIVKKCKINRHPS